MKTLSIISMIVMAFVTLFFIVFAQIQKGYSEEASAIVAEQEQRIVESQEQIQIQAAIAQEKAAETVQAENLAIQIRKELEACKNQ